MSFRRPDLGESTDEIPTTGSEASTDELSAGI
jgi:hypothetical protein